MMRSVTILLATSLLAGCVTRIEPINSNFGTVQNGRKCYTVADGDGRFNSPTFQAPPQECDCRDLVPVKRLVVKAGQSPEVMSCPMDAHTVQSTYAPSTASIYIPAAGQAAIGAGIGAGLAASQAARMTQSVTGSSVRTSTLLINAPVPGGVAP